MNAVPISMNPASNGNAAAAACNQTVKVPGPQPFAQVLAERQSAAGAPNGKTSPAPRVAENRPDAQNAALPQTTSNATARSSTVRSVQPRIVTSVGTPAATAPAKKSDPRSNGTFALGSHPIVNAMATVTGPIELQVNIPQDARKSAGAPLATIVQPADAQLPAVEPVPASALSPVQAQDPLAQLPPATPPVTLQNPPPVPTNAPATARNFAEPIGAGEAAPAVGTPSVDVHSRARGSQVAASAPQSPSAPIAAPLSMTDPMAAQLSPAAPTPQSSAAASSTQIAGMVAAELPPAARKPAETRQTQNAINTTAKHNVAEFLHGIASAAAKSMEAAMQAGARLTKDAATALKSKSAGNDSSVVDPPNPVLGAKTESPIISKSEAPAAPPAADPGNGNATNNGNNADGAPESSDAASAGSSAGTGSSTASNDHAENVGAEPAHGGIPTPQSYPLNPGIGPVTTTSAIPLSGGKESGSAAKSPSGNNTDNGGASATDAEELRPQALESRVVNVAQLAGNGAHSEVRIAMQADQLGQVQLHATVSGQQVGASIIVERKEAHAAMAVELPSLQQALEERHLRVSEVVLTQNALHSTADDSSNAGNAPAEQRRNHPGIHYQRAAGDTTSGYTPAESLANSRMFDDHGRLSVRV